MTQKDVEKSLDNQMNEYKVVYPIPVEYPDVSYIPVVGTSYLKIDYLHSETEQVELGSDSDDRARGIYQITINVENNNGSLEFTTILNQLKEYFKRGTVATYNGLNVRIASFNLGSYLSEADWYRGVVNIIFRSDISN